MENSLEKIKQILAKVEEIIDSKNQEDDKRECLNPCESILRLIRR